MNPFEFVLGIILITTIGAILKARFGHPGRERHRDRHRGRDLGYDEPADDAETLRLKEEVRALKERLHVLERIAVDKENSLAREIDDLRNR